MIEKKQDDSLAQLQNVLGRIDDLRSTVVRLIQSKMPEPELRDREYKFCGAALSHHMPSLTMDLSNINVNPEEVVKPGDTRAFLFGVEFIANPGIPGLPETATKTWGVERRFLLESLVIDDACASNFHVLSLFAGAQACWGSYAEIPASRFAASSPRVMLRMPTPKGVTITVHVKCTAKTPSVFRAKVIGKEPVLDVNEEEGPDTGSDMIRKALLGQGRLWGAGEL